MWPADAAALAEQQAALAAATVPAFTFAPSCAVGACFVCFARGGGGAGRWGDPGWAGAAAALPGEPMVVVAVAGEAGGPYLAGFLALREGALLEAAARALPRPPSVLLVNGTGRDHPRGAGLALHLGAVLGVPTVGVTHRPLLAAGTLPADRRGSASPLLLGGRTVGYWLRTRPGARPLAVHAAWATSADTAAQLVLAATGEARTPEPLRAARTAARRARAASG